MGVCYGLIVTVVVASLGSLAEPSEVAAQAAPRAKRNTASAVSVQELAVMLVSSNPDELRMAIELAAQAPKEVTPLLVERVRAGLPADLLTQALDTLIGIGDGAANDLLIELSGHRRPEIRSRALLGLVTLRAPSAEASLVKGLSDAVPDVRSTAAHGLGMMGARHSLPELFRAFERGVDGAAAAIGELAEPTTLPRVTDYIGRSSFADLTPLLDGLFLRRNLPDDSKLSLLDAIVKHGSSEARAYLEGLGPKLLADSSARLRKSITEAATRMPK